MTWTINSGSGTKCSVLLKKTVFKTNQPWQTTVTVHKVKTRFARSRRNNFSACSKEVKKVCYKKILRLSPRHSIVSALWGRDQQSISVSLNAKYNWCKTADADIKNGQVQYFRSHCSVLALAHFLALPRLHSTRSSIAQGWLQHSKSGSLNANIIDTKRLTQK